MVKGLSTMLQYLFIVGLLMIAGAAAPAGALAGGSDWAQWRGPDGQGVSSEKGLPLEWGAKKNIQWKTAIPGRGHSSPIVWGNRIFLTTSIEGPVVPDSKPPKHMIGKEEFNHPDWFGAGRSYTLKVLCLDSNTGKVLWEQTAYEGPIADYRHRKNTYASSTPVTDGQHVYAFFGSEGVYCFDMGGKLVWKNSFGPILQLGMGFGTSPILFNNLVILQCDQQLGEGSFITALDKKTGKQVWKVTRSHRMSWTTPVLVNTGKRTELVANGAETVVSYDPNTGEELWRVKGVEGHAIPSTLVGHGLAILSAGYPAKRVVAVKLGATGDLTDTSNVAWTYDKGTAYVPSPILYGDYVYLMSDRGILTCIDAKTGKVVYEGGRVPVPATFFASPVAFDGKILLTSEDGDTFIIEAGPAHKVLGTNSLEEPVYASPALANGKIFIRGESNLYCISSKAGK